MQRLLAISSTATLALAALAPSSFAGDCLLTYSRSRVYSPNLAGALLDLDTGDLDGDGDTDVVVLGEHELRVYFNLGNGQLQAAPIVNLANNPICVSLADMNADGSLDLVVLDRGNVNPATGLAPNDGVGVLTNNGAGSFGAETLELFPAQDREPRELLIGDVDGDGQFDVFVNLIHGTSNDARTKLAVMLNGGAGLAIAGYTSTADVPGSFTVADFTGDGFSDYAFYGGEILQVAVGAGDGTFATTDIYSTISDDGAHLIGHGDWGGDGDVDLAVVNSNSWTGLLNDGAGQFGLLGYDITGGGAVAFGSGGDINDDGGDEFAFVVNGVVQGRSAGGFSWGVEGPGTVALQLADLWGDGYDELLVIGREPGTLTVHDYQCAVETYGQGKVNSLGCTPQIYGYGTPSLGGLDFFGVSATNEIPDQPGMLISGTTQGNTPFAGGTLLVGTPWVRYAIVDSGSAAFFPCSGGYTVPISDAELGNMGVVPGSHVYFQFLSRDPGHPDGSGIALTNGLRVMILP